MQLFVLFALFVRRRQAVQVSAAYRVTVRHTGQCSEPERHRDMPERHQGMAESTAGTPSKHRWNTVEMAQPLRKCDRFVNKFGISFLKPGLYRKKLSIFGIRFV